ncbi:tail fiber protein [Yersinia enterocolitica]
MTIVRGQEGTVSRLWSANDISANMMTAGTLDLFAQSGTLGGAALLNVGTTAGTVAAGNDNRITGALQKSANLSDLPSPQTALTNLGVPSSSLVPIGVPLPYPLATAPTGYLKCNGSSFSTAEYLKLALVYPSGILPDLRGEFIRGWDDGRGVDTGRALGSAQASTGLRTAALDYYGIDATTYGGTVGTAFNQPDSLTKTQPGDAKTPDNGVLGDVLSDNSIQATQVQAGIQSGSVWITTRPRNVAFNYIVRAA